MPVGTVTSGTSNHIAQLARHDSAESSEGSRPASRSLVGGETREGVSIGGSSNRGDLNDQESEPAVIQVTNSTDLSALAQAVALASFGEDLEISDSNFASAGGVNIDAGTIFERTLTLRNTTIVADIIKARAYNNGGRDALVIDGGRFDAGRLVRLYAEGDSTLRFRGEVEIESPLTQLAAKRVEVDAGSRVRASGSVRIDADAHNYDRAGYGTIEAAGGKTTGAFSERSRY